MLTQRTHDIVSRYKELKNLRQVGAEFNISHEAVRLHLIKYEKETQTTIWRMYGVHPIGLVWTCKICGKENGPAYLSKKTKLCRECSSKNSPTIKYSNQTIETWLKEIKNGKTIYRLALEQNSRPPAILQTILSYFYRNNQLDRALDFFHFRSVYWLKKKRNNWPEFFNRVKIK